MLTNIFLKIYDYFHSHKNQLYFLFVLLTALSIFGSLELEFKEDISDFLPTGEAYSKVSKFVSSASGNSRIMIFFKSEDSLTPQAEIAQCMDLYAETLKKSDDSVLFKDLVSKFDDKSINEISGFIQQNIPYFLDSTDYLHADSCLSNEHINSALDIDKKLLLSPAPQFVKNTIKNDPLGMFLPILSDLKNFKPSNCYSYINGHIFEPELNRGIIFFDSPAGMSESNVNSRIVSILEENAEVTMSKFPKISVSIFGAPVIAVGNSSQIKSDTILTTVISIALIIIILCFSIRNFQNLLMISLTLLFGFLVAGAVSWLVLGKVSLISLGISATFTGIAANYPLHFVTHLYHSENVRSNIREIVGPLVTGNITTVAAFLSLMFAGSNALSDLGFIGGILLTASILFTLVFLPHFVKKVEVGQERGTKFNFDFLQKKAVVVPVLLLTPVLVYFSFQTEFDSNLRNINFMTDELRAEADHTFKLLNSDSTVSVFVTSMGRDFDDALTSFEASDNIAKSLVDSNLVVSVSGISKFIPSRSKQAECLRLWNCYMNKNRDSIIAKLEFHCQINKIKTGVFANFDSILNRDFKVVDACYFDAIINNGLKNYIHEDSSGVAIVSILKVKPENAESVVGKFSGLSDKVFAYDERIVSQSFASALNDNFNFVLFAAGAIVFVFLVCSFGSVELSLITFVPLTISWFWILGMMAIFGVKFNIVNIILATFIFGQGDDYAVFITEGLMYEYASGKKVLASFKNSVALSSLIMFVGIGSLVLAKHPAMQSLGVIVIIGMFSVVLASFIFPPLIFNFLVKSKNKRRESPISLKKILFSLVYFLVFLTACIILFVRSLFTSDKIESKKKFHRFLQKIAKMIYMIPGARFSTHNPNGENFSKPSILLANHSSSFDVLCLLTLSPNLLFVTNKQQQGNFFYGRILKKADFYSTSDGYENLSAKLKEFVNSGFSIVVFPEGTRSVDGKIHRFHQGAFHLSRELQLDIMPVVIHGAARVFPKNSFFINSGKIDVFIENRIKPDSPLITSTALETARNIRHYFLGLYEYRRCECVDFDYAKMLVMERFMYKGVEITRYVSKELDNRRESIMNKPVADTAIFDDTCYGADALLFRFLHPEARVVVDGNDEDRLSVARECGVEVF